MNSKKEICIIGCGIAGLSALRVFSEEIDGFSQNYTIYGYEKTNKIGGIWNYNDLTEGDFITPMYRDLRTNLPKELMGFPDFSFDANLTKSFIHHSEVLRYLKSYADHFQLEKFIEYNSHIISIEPFKTEDIQKWKVDIQNQITLSVTEKFFDIVLICNGHFEIPKIPQINGIENFKGEYIHSKCYRFPEKFIDKTVFVLGAKSSGLDIALQLIPVSKMVYLSHNRHRLAWKIKKKNFKETYGISHIDNHGKVCLTDGSVYEADVIVSCTGYEINLNFLSQSAGLEFDNTYVRPLYKHMINPFYPTSCFIIGLGYEIPPFSHCYMQCKVARAIIHDCSFDIPLSTDKLLVEIEKEKEEFERDKIEMRHRHYLSDKEWPYLRWCASASRNVMTSVIPRYYEDMFNIVRKWRYKNTAEYREIDFRLVDNKLGFEICSGPENDFYTSDFNELLL